MAEQELIETLEEGVVTLTLNRPERFNALSPTLLSTLAESLRRLAADPAVSVVVMTGAGRAFCAGGDVKRMAEGGQAPSFEQSAYGLRASMESSRLLHEMPKPTIAMLNGVAAGAGLSLALACDFRFAATSARMTTAFAKVGLSGDFGGTYFLPWLVGAAKAREMYLDPEPIDMHEADRLGLVTRVVPDAELAEVTMAYARKLASGPRVAYGYLKRNLNATESGISLSGLLDLEAMHMTRSRGTDDHAEAARAFVEKREPRFEGR